MAAYEQTEVDLLRDAPLRDGWAAGIDRDTVLGETTYRLVQAYSRDIGYRHARAQVDADTVDATVERISGAVQDGLEDIFGRMGLDTTAPVLAERYWDRIADRLSVTAHRSDPDGAQPLSDDRPPRYDIRLARPEG